MKLSNLKFAVVGVMAMAVLSLNLVNPFSSQSYDDVKGMATEIPLSATASQGDLAQAWTPTTTTISVLLIATSWTSVTIAALGGDTTVDTELLDESSNVSASDVLLGKLD